MNGDVSEIKVASSVVLFVLAGMSLVGCARYSAVGECQALGITEGYWSGAGKRCVEAKLDPSSRTLVEDAAAQACSRARQLDQTGDPDAACQQAQIEAERSAWFQIASTPPGSTPDLSVDNLVLSLRQPVPTETVQESQLPVVPKAPEIATAAAAPTERSTNDRRIPASSSNNVRVAPHAKSGFKLTGQDGEMKFVLIEKDSERNRASYDAAIGTLCQAGKTCTIHFWSDPAFAPKKSPVSPEQAEAEVATYSKDPKAPSGQFLWSCRLKDDPNHCF